LCRRFGAKKKIQSQPYEGDAEELAHMEGEIFFEGGLRFFDEFYEDAPAKYPEQEEAEGAIRLLPEGKVTPVRVEEHSKKQEVGRGFVELGGVTGVGVYALKDEGPGEGGDFAVDFGVEEVAQADEGSGERCGDSEAVGQPPQRLLRMPAAIQPQSHQNSHSTPMTGKTPLPDFENLYGIAQIVGRLIKEAMSEASANHRSQNHIP
jgi:hypothetical protein